MFEPLDVQQMSHEEILMIKKDNNLGLTIEEIKKVQDILKRPPTRTELIIWDIQGSEHCSYRSTRQYIKTLPTEAPNVILGVGEDAGIVEIARDKEERWGIAVSHESHNHPSQVVPYEGAATGIGGNVRDIACMGAKVVANVDALRFGDITQHKLLRSDARSEAETLSRSRIIAQQVVEGIGGYGNPLGIPNLAGSASFNASFNDNCLVNVLSVGVIKESDIIHSYCPKEAAEEGWDIIIVGKPTDNSGMGGASFASLTLNEDDKEKNKGAVQEPNPFLKRHLLHATYDLFEILKGKNAINPSGRQPMVSFKDMGAGGNTCSTVEQVLHWGLGAIIDLKKIHVAINYLHPSVIAASETQERFAWMCHPSLTQLIVEHYNTTWELPKVAENARASVVGKVTNGNFVLKYGDDIVLDAPATDICEGLRYNRDHKPAIKDLKEPDLDPNINLKDTILNILSNENIASQEPIYERYDKTVQGITVIDRGLADAGVIAPLIDICHPNGRDAINRVSTTGVAIAESGNPRYGAISAYHQATNAVATAMRKVAAVGAFPIGLTDCLNYGNPEKPEPMQDVIDGIKGLKDAATGIKLHPSITVDCKLSTVDSFPTPYLAGNSSLYNESSNGKSINPTTIVGAFGRMDDYHKAVSMSLRRAPSDDWGGAAATKQSPEPKEKPQATSSLFLLGTRKNELGGSILYDILDQLGANVPKIDNFKEVQSQIYTVAEAVQQNLILSSHVIDDGGLIVAIAEMMINQPEQKFVIPTGAQRRERITPTNKHGQSYPIGVELNLSHIPDTNLTPLQLLFSETGGFVVEVDNSNIEAFESLCATHKLTSYLIGKTTNNQNLTIVTEDENLQLAIIPLSEMKKAWEEGLRVKLYE